MKLFKVYREISKEESSKRPINFMPEGFWLKVCQTQIKDKLISFFRCLVCPFNKISTTSILKNSPSLSWWIDIKPFLNDCAIFKAILMYWPSISYCDFSIDSKLMYIYVSFKLPYEICLFVHDKKKLNILQIVFEMKKKIKIGMG